MIEVIYLYYIFILKLVNLSIKSFFWLSFFKKCIHEVLKLDNIFEMSKSYMIGEKPF